MNCFDEFVMAAMLGAGDSTDTQIGKGSMRSSRVG